MQFEDEITPNGWTTNYQSLMRVEPKVKSIISGQKGYKPKEKFINPNKHPRSKIHPVLKSKRWKRPKKILKVVDRNDAQKDHFQISDKQMVNKSLNKLTSVLQKN